MEELFQAIDRHLRLARMSLDYDDLYFVLRTVRRLGLYDPEDPRGLLLSVSRGYNNILALEYETVTRAVEEAGLKPGDTAITAYSQHPMESPICVSIAKVVSWEDCCIPREVVHIWPVDTPNLKIDPRSLCDKNLKDERQIET